ncbi:MAG: hypothetical protein ACK5LV_10890, partial [Lachnospirales bacterium]
DTFDLLKEGMKNTIVDEALAVSGIGVAAGTLLKRDKKDDEILKDPEKIADFNLDETETLDDLDDVKNEVLDSDVDFNLDETETLDDLDDVKNEVLDSDVDFNLDETETLDNLDDVKNEVLDSDVDFNLDETETLDNLDDVKNEVLDSDVDFNLDETDVNLTNIADIPSNIETDEETTKFKESLIDIDDVVNEPVEEISGIDLGDLSSVSDDVEETTDFIKDDTDDNDETFVFEKIDEKTKSDILDIIGNLQEEKKQEMKNQLGSGLDYLQNFADEVNKQHFDRGVDKDLNANVSKRNR